MSKCISKGISFCIHLPIHLPFLLFFISLPLSILTSNESTNIKMLTYRPVLLHTRPRVYIEDITVRTGFVDDVGIVKYIIQPAGLHEYEIPICRVTLLDADDSIAAKEPVYGFSGTLKVPFANLWWPRGMSRKPGYLYTLEVLHFLRYSSRGNSLTLDASSASLRYNQL